MLDEELAAVERSVKMLDQHGRDFMCLHASRGGTLATVDGFSARLPRHATPMPAVRHAVVASSLGLSFPDEGYLLTDARTHRGTSGAFVIPPLAEVQLALEGAVADVTH